ncbi:MAG: hypothetical protein KKG33_02190 [candidate division Zixibacteria bacterium]|nr:hypothetical protein [candidate division Zixibacteria bacterium]MBU2624351.1 hypothetical protein [candidate division Zixibacteria bacterium]
MNLTSRIGDLLSNIDRRIVFGLVLLSVVFPLLAKFPLPVVVSPESQALFDRVERIPDGSKIMLTFDYYPSTLAETEPMSIAALKHCWRKNLKIVTLSTVGLGGPNIADRVMATLAEQFGKKYGVDYVNLGYKANYQAVLLGLGKSFRSIYPTDFYGTPLDSLPLMQEIDSYGDLQFIYIVSDNGIVDYWVGLVNAQYNIEMGAGVTAVMAPKFYAYVRADQLVGLLGGMKGASEYEHLVGAEALATSGMGAQSLVHLTIIGFIIIGNVAFFLGRRKR